MSRIDADRFRGCLEYALRFDVSHHGSLYLRALACVYLVAPEPAEPTLSHEFHLQAEAESADPYQVLLALLEGVPS